MKLHRDELRTVPSMLRWHAEKDGDATFLVDERGTVSRGAMLELSEGMNGAFADLGVSKSDPVAIMMDNRREFTESWFGLAFRGAIEVPVNPDNVGHRLVHVLNHSMSRVCVVQAEYLSQIEEVADELSQLEKLVVVGDGRIDGFDCVSFDDLERRPTEPADIGFTDPVAVMYTSGSTGPAKGALLSHGHHYMNGYQPAHLFDMSSEDSVYVCLPLHHNMAQGYGVMPALVSGASVKIAPRFNAETFWADIADGECTILPFVGAMLVLLAKRPATSADGDNSLRIGYGIPIPPDLHEAFEERFGLTLVHAYGSTEATIVAWNYGDERVVGAAGRPFPGYEVEIHGIDDRALPPGEAGEICVRPREPYSMFSEYYREPQETVQTFRNLWYHSGDRGRFDDVGNLWFVDRIGDVIRRLGENISSYEVEQTIIGHPEVKLAAAYGVPSELIEEEVVAAVVRQPGSELSERDLRQWCQGRLPRYAIPRYIAFVDELPMTPTGKVEKYVLRQVGIPDNAYDARQER